MAQRIVYMFTNPISGGSRGDELISIAKQGGLPLSDQSTGLNVLLKIFDIRDGASGSKPSFNELKADIKTHTVSTDEPSQSTNGVPLSVIPVIVAGGDGTVMWALSEIEKHSIDCMKVAVTVLPFGTGNDFSRATRWGGGAPWQIVGENGSALKKLVSGYLKGRLSSFDLWSVSMNINSEGGVYQIKNGKKVKVTVEETRRPSFHYNHVDQNPNTKADVTPVQHKESKESLDVRSEDLSDDETKRVTYQSNISIVRSVRSPSTEPGNKNLPHLPEEEFDETIVYERIIKLEKPCCNYFSIGTEARIGLGFDRNRTKSACCNKAVYLTEGAKKMALHFDNPKLIEFIDNVEILSPDQSTAPDAEDINATENTKQGDTSQLTHKKLPVLASNPSSLIFMNVNSISAGIDLWSGAKLPGAPQSAPPPHSDTEQEDTICASCFGGSKKQKRPRRRQPQAPVTTTQNSQNSPTHGTKSAEQDHFGQQSYSDGKVEVMTVPSLFAMSRAMISPWGVATKHAQTDGPVVINFRKDLSKEKRIYMQIDGEFFQVNLPETIVFSHNRKVQIIDNY